MSATRKPTLIALAAVVLASAIAYLVLGGEDAVSAPIPHAAEPSTSHAGLEIAPEIVAADSVRDGETVRSALPEAARVRGIVVHAEDGAPFPGVGVRLVTFRETRAETVSDADGVFDLPLLEGTGRAVEVVVPEGFDTRDRRVRLRGEGPPDPIRFELARDAGLPVIVRVVDAADGSPQPELEVELGGPRAAVRRATTDALGIARLPERWAPGPVTVAPIDAGDVPDARSAGTFEHGDSDEIPSAAVHLGPTFELEFELPPQLELDDFCAWLEPERDRHHRSLDDRQRLHAGARPWVRFTRPDLYFAGEVLPRRLVVASHDGLWRGSALVSTTLGRAPQPVSIELAPQGVVRVRVLDPGGRELPDAHGFLIAPADGSPPLVINREAGLLAFEGVPAGTYELRVEELDHLPSSRTLAVEVGRETQIELRLERRAGGGAVSGEVRSLSGRAGVADWVHLAPRTEDHGHWRTAVVEWRAGEEPAVGRFRFENVPAGVYDLSASGGGEDAIWEPASIEVEPPRGGLVLTLQDGGPMCWLDFRVIERGTGKGVPNPRLRVGTDFGEADDMHVFGAGAVAAGPMPLKPDVRWRLSADGFLDATGSIDDLGPSGTRRGHELRRLRVELERGWQVRVQAWSDEGGRAVHVGGARVSLDGVEVGVTDTSGQLLLRRDVPPRLLRIDAAGFRPYELADDGLLAGEARDWDGPNLVDVILEP